MRSLSRGILIAAYLLIAVGIFAIHVFGQSGAVYKDPSNKLLETAYNKWASIDLQPYAAMTPGYFGSGFYGTLRWRIDGITGFAPFAFYNPTTKTYAYITQVYLSNGLTFYDSRSYDQFANAMLGMGWGTGSPQSYIYPPSTQPIK